jgi:hypothetical protein
MSRALSSSAGWTSDNDHGGGAVQQLLTSLAKRQLTPGTKGWRFAGWRPMPDHIAFSLARRRGVIDEWRIEECRLLGLKRVGPHGGR